MKKKYFLISLTILFVLFSILFVVSPFLFSKKEKVVSSDISTLEISNYNGFAYIDSSNNLILLNSDTNAKEVVAKNVSNFNISNNNLVYTSSDSSKRLLTLFNISSKETAILRDYYINDYILQGNLLYIIENNIIKVLDILSDSCTNLVELGTSDLVFNSVDDNSLIFSYIKDSVPTTFKLDIKTNTLITVGQNLSNIITANDYIYALDEKYNILRLNKNLELERIDNLSVVKFYINEDYLVYIDDRGILNSLDINGNNRVIADFASDFYVSENILYYSTPKAKNKVFKTQLNGRHKEIVVDDSNINLKFKQI